MDATLRCNKPNGACRAPLVDRAVVTTCCHIFCLQCANELGLTRATAENRFCPACNQALPNTDDAVTTLLQPTEDYKTSVLSGLNPTTIMECAGRALAFWSYQTAQEIAYQEHLGKILTEKYTHLSRGMDKIINEANTEIQTLQQKVTSMGVDFRSLQQKNTELVELYKEKNRKHQQTQHMYDVLKKKVLMNNVHTAASENVNQTLQSIESQHRPETYIPTSSTNAQGVSNVHNRQPQTMSFDNRVEQLHTHQRSGSSNHGSDFATMRPPQMTPNRHHMTGALPVHRAPLGESIDSARASMSRSQHATDTRHFSHGYGTNYPSSTQRASTATRQQFQTLGGQSTSGNFGLQPRMKVGGSSGRGQYIQRPASLIGR